MYNNKTKKGELVADGIAFSSKNSETCPKSLNYILEAIDQDIYNLEGFELGKSYDLTKWANQGILLVNCGLTTTIGKAGAHIQLWSPFINYLFNLLNLKKDNLGVILMGSHARKNKNLFTNETFKVFECEHPASAAYRGGKWNHNHVFKELTEFQKTKNNIEIKW